MEIKSLNINNINPYNECITLNEITLYNNLNSISTYSSNSYEASFDSIKKHKWFIEKLKKEKLDDFAPLEIYKGYYTKIKLLHKSCMKSFEATPHNFFRRKNKCPHCNEDVFILNSCKNEHNLKTKDSIIQEKLNEIHNGEFKFIRVSPSDKLTVELKHSECGKSFTDYRRKLYSNKITCPYCSKSTSKNNFIPIKDKIKIYEEKLNSKFIILEGFTKQKEKIKMKRVSCGHIITRSLNEVLKKSYKDVCPECKRLERLDSLTKKLEVKYNNRIKVIDGIEKYKNNQSNLTFFDTRCNNNFTSSFTKLLNFEMNSCPKCNNSYSIRNEVFNKYKGEYIALEEYVNSTTPILFKHKTCNHVFRKTKAKFFSAKIPCDKCSTKSRSLGLKKAQEKVSLKFGKLFTLKGTYKNRNTELFVTCNNCNKVEEVSLNNLLNREKCPNCKKSFK